MADRANPPLPLAAVEDQLGPPPPPPIFTTEERTFLRIMAAAILGAFAALAAVLILIKAR